MSWKPAFLFRNEDKPCTNGEVYATQEEALASAHQRFCVWTMPTGYTAVETTDPVNGEWIESVGRVTDDFKEGHMAPEQVRIA